MFESFVADIMQDVLASRAKVTQASGDYGVDIFHTLPNRNVYLVQVKCYKPENKINFDPVALLHFNILTRIAQCLQLVIILQMLRGSLMYKASN
jgi:restriction system protein